MTAPIVLGGLTYRGVDIQTENLFLDLASSLYEPADHRGKDDIVPGRIGRYRRNRVPDQRIVALNGWTRGTGSTAVERRESWDAAEAILGALLDPAADAGALVAIPPYMGLTGGPMTLQAVVSSWIAGDVEGSLSFRRWSIELLSLAPDWIEESPS